MFNRQPFNIGSFNTTASTTSLYVSGTAALAMTATTALAAIYKGKGSGFIELGATGKLANKIEMPAADPADIVMTSRGNLKHIKKMTGQADMELLASSAGYLTLEGAEIQLSGLVLKPGDELIIDTDNMTITLNGINVLSYITDASSFFAILPGLNTLTVEAGTNTEFKVLWKDRWL
jgi:hypothetical protein